MGSIDQEQRMLWPELVTEPDGTEWVQIVDEYGFAGYDPTDEQIVEAVIGNDKRNVSQKELHRVGDIALNTTVMHAKLIGRAEEEFRGLDLPLYGWHLRNKDIARAGRRIPIHRPTWRDIRRTTDEQPQGEQ